MPSPRRVIAFALVVLAVTLALLAPWPGLDRVYAFGFRGVADVLFGSIGTDGVVRFELNPQSGTGMDTLIVLGNRATGAKAHAPLSARMIGYVPTALAMALCLFTPSRWVRRIVTLSAVLALIQVFIAARLYLRLLEIFSAGDTLAVFDPGPVARVFVSTLSQVLSVSLLGSFLVPVLIWAALALRPDDWRAPRTAGNLSN
jgi:hypothetical protein